MLSDLLVGNVRASDRQVLITEITRMNAGLVCVAGIDLQSGRMVRPLQPDGSNWEEAKWVRNDSIHVGSIVAVRPAVAGPAHYPHATEDFRCANLVKVGAATDRQLYRACITTADPDIDTLFANQVIDAKYVIDGTRCRSLGCVMVDADDLRLSEYRDKVQVSWQDPPKVWHNLSVTEVAIRTPGADVGLRLLRARLLHVTGDVALRVGLARGWDGNDAKYNPKRCYLQLNGLIVPA